MLQLLPHLLTLTVNWQKRVFSEFILRSVGLALHDWLFRDTHFTGPFKLESSDSSRPRFMAQTPNNPIRFF